MAEFYRKKKKVCQLCAGKELNYKDVENIKKYVDREKHKILLKSSRKENPPQIIISLQDFKRQYNGKYVLALNRTIKFGKVTSTNKMLSHLPLISLL